MNFRGGDWRLGYKMECDDGAGHRGRKRTLNWHPEMTGMTWSGRLAAEFWIY